MLSPLGTFPGWGWGLQKVPGNKVIPATGDIPRTYRVPAAGKKRSSGGEEKMVVLFLLSLFIVLMVFLVLNIGRHRCARQSRPGPGGAL